MQLYLGLDPTRLAPHAHHYPIIEIHPLPHALDPLIAFWHTASHIIFSSRTAVKIFYQESLSLRLPIDHFQILSIGQATTELATELGFRVTATAPIAQAEGFLTILPPKNTLLFYPHAKGARDVLKTMLLEGQYAFKEAILYETRPKNTLEPIDLKLFTTLIFSSPSCVQAFLHHFGTFPPNTTLLAIGEITLHALKTALSQLKLDFRHASMCGV